MTTIVLPVAIAMAATFIAIVLEHPRLQAWDNQEETNMDLTVDVTRNRLDNVIVTVGSTTHYLSYADAQALHRALSRVCQGGQSINEAYFYPNGRRDV